MSDVAKHYDVSAVSYHEQYDENLIWQNAEYPANLFRLRIVTRILRKTGARSVYEFGAGEATPLVRLHEALNIGVAGNDVSPEMVRLGKMNLQQHGLSPDALTLLDIEDVTAIQRERNLQGGFDAVMALGVIPHVADDEAFVSAMAGFCDPGGQLLLQFRNSLFSLFTFNRLTKEFILDELMVDVPQQFRDVVSDDLDKRLAVDKPPVRSRPDGHGYDEILSRFHNPFELADVVRSAGFQDVRFHWYNYHPTYPMLANQCDPRAYREAQVHLEGDATWRGMFLCSAGLIQATKRP